MLIYTPLPSYASSTVVSSPLLSFRKHNIILSLAASISSHGCQRLSRQDWRRGGEGTRLATRARARAAGCGVLGIPGLGLTRTYTHQPIQTRTVVRRTVHNTLPFINQNTALTDTLTCQVRAYIIDDL